MQMKRRRSEEVVEEEEPSSYRKLLALTETTRKKMRVEEESDEELQEMSDYNPLTLLSHMEESDDELGENPNNVDPFAKNPFKSFPVSLLPSDRLWADTTKNIRNTSVVAIDFRRKMKDSWFNHFYTPYEEKALEKMIKRYEKKRNDFESYEITHPEYKVLAEKVSSNKKLPAIHGNLNNYLIERDLWDLWSKEVLGITARKDLHSELFRNDFERAFFSILNDYRDFYYPATNSQNKPFLIQTLALHIVNHIVKKQRYEKYCETKQKVIGEQYEVKYATPSRPSILLIVPFRSTAHELLTAILQILPKIDLKRVEKWEAFDALFSEEEEESEQNEEDGEEGAPKSNKKNKKKPAWWREIFQGNLDDNFALPVKINLFQRSASLMGDAKDCDIIIATPVGLISGDKNGKFTGALACVEIAAVLDADILLMQNWEHVVTSLSMINVPPTKSQKVSQDVDWPNVRTPLLLEKADSFRQTIILSRYMNPDINGLLSYCNNMRGIVKARNLYTGVVTQTKGSVVQVFERYECSSMKKDSDKRHDYFVNHVFPRFKKSASGRFLIVVSTYLDFVRVRNFFNAERIPFHGLSEYTENARNLLTKFRNDDARYIIYTERHFYYNAPKLKDFKINQIFFYSLPENDFIYKQFVERAAAIAQSFSACRVLSIFSVFDALKLERITGTDRAKDILTDTQNVHVIEK